MGRTMKKGDTWPPLRGEAADDFGTVLDLTSATSLEVTCTSPSHIITGVAVPISPPLVDADGIHSWNWEYIFVAGDTDHPDTYEVLLTVVWATGETQTFPNTGSETLIIEDKP